MANSEDFIKGVYDKANKNDCSGFLKDLAKELLIFGTAVPDKRADDIIDFITNSPGYWIKIGEGPGFANKAAMAAGQGYLVIALLKAKDHVSYTHHSGHVAIVVPPPLLGGYPRVICGSSGNAQSDGRKGVKGVWTGKDAPLVKYYQSTILFDALRDAK